MDERRLMFELGVQSVKGSSPESRDAAQELAKAIMDASPATRRLCAAYEAYRRAGKSDCEGTNGKGVRGRDAAEKTIVARLGV